MKKELCYLLAALLIAPVMLHAQDTAPQVDTLHLSIDSADKIFLRNNLQLLAQRYNINAQKALEVQARLYPNPTVQVGQSLYSPKVNELFPIGKMGETTAELSQLVQLAGKRNKQVKLAEANTQLSVLQFSDLLKTLKYTLHTDLYTVYYLSKSAAVYQEEINSLQKLSNAFAFQLSKGNVSEKEALRIKAQLYSFQSERNDLLNQIISIESELRQLLHLQKVIISPILNQQQIDSYNALSYSYQSIVDSALEHHPGIQIANLNTETSALNYQYQRALAVPDLTFTLGYDQQGGYVKNLTTLGVAIDLPFFNRNQGNIRFAKMMTNMAQINEENETASVEETIFTALKEAASYDELYKSRDKTFDNSFKQIQQAALTNYQRRNIGLLDFLDLYDSYKENALQLNQLQINRINAFEAINYYAGCEIFPNL